MRVTLLVSAGDNGVAGGSSQCSADSSSTQSPGTKVRSVNSILCIVFAFYNVIVCFCVPNILAQFLGRQGLFSLFPRHIPVCHCGGRHDGHGARKPGGRLPVRPGRRDHHGGRVLQLLRHPFVAAGRRGRLLCESVCRADPWSCALVLDAAQAAELVDAIKLELSLL